MKRPLTCVNLIKAIGTLSVGQDPVRLSRAIANVIVAQMLPDGVVKGGSSLLFRYGDMVHAIHAILIRRGLWSLNHILNS